jgi:hypothetical protein
MFFLFVNHMMTKKDPCMKLLAVSIGAVRPRPGCASSKTGFFELPVSGSEAILAVIEQIKETGK